MLYEVFNNLNTSLTLEDIGVTLQARGGKDSSRIITRDMHDASADLRRMLRMRMVSVATRPPVAPRPAIPIWPLSVRRDPAPSPPVQLSPPPVQLARDPGMSALASSVAQLDGKMAEILALLRTGAVSAAGPPAPVTPARSEPVFLPSKMVPDAEVSMNVTESESAADGFDASKEALARIRGKQ